MIHKDNSEESLDKESLDKESLDEESLDKESLDEERLDEERLDEEIPTEIVLSGGHFATVAFLGKIHKLIKENSLIISSIKRWICTSGGSIVALFLILGYSPLEIKDTFKEIAFHKLSPINASMWLEFFDKLGLHDTKNIALIIESFIEHKGFDKNLTFLDLKELYDVELIFMTFCVNSSELIEMSYLNYPHATIIEGIQMAIAAPLIFKPFSFQNRLYIDAVISSNCPATKCQSNNAYIFRIKKNKEYYDTINIFNHLKIIFTAMIERIENLEICNTSSHKVFDIYTNFSVGSTLDIQPEKIEELFINGYNA
tara:strand:- start:3972 stop:4910 length:939 start_codon:yes stop_codon:yes gene_type:complete